MQRGKKESEGDTERQRERDRVSVREREKRKIEQKAESRNSMRGYERLTMGEKLIICLGLTQNHIF